LSYSAHSLNNSPICACLGFQLICITELFICCIHHLHLLHLLPNPCHCCTVRRSCIIQYFIPIFISACGRARAQPVNTTELAVNTSVLTGAAQMGTPYAAADDIMAKIRAVDENVQTTFRKIDKDGNGWISKKELKDGLKQLGIVAPIGCPFKDFKALWDVLDTNNDGRVNWSEWLKSLREAHQRCV